jgi:hypothetical protein
MDKDMENKQFSSSTPINGNNQSATSLEDINMLDTTQSKPDDKRAIPSTRQEMTHQAHEQHPNKLPRIYTQPRDDHQHGIGIGSHGEILSDKQFWSPPPASGELVLIEPSKNDKTDQAGMELLIRHEITRIQQVRNDNCLFLTPIYIRFFPMQLSLNTTIQVPNLQHWCLMFLRQRKSHKHECTLLCSMRLFKSW